MLLFGYAGESGLMPALPAFVLGVAFWVYMIYTLWMGEGKEAVSTTSASVQTAYSTMMWIIIVGWAIYPIGYFMGYMMGSVDASSLNLIYNLADFVNKILFGLVILAAAVEDKKLLKDFRKHPWEGHEKEGYLALFFYIKLEIYLFL